MNFKYDKTAVSSRQFGELLRQARIDPHSVAYNYSSGNLSGFSLDGEAAERLVAIIGQPSLKRRLHQALARASGGFFRSHLLQAQQLTEGTKFGSGCLIGPVPERDLPAPTHHSVRQPNLHETLAAASELIPNQIHRRREARPKIAV